VKLDIELGLPFKSDFFFSVAPKVQAIFGVLDGLVAAPFTPHRKHSIRSQADYFTWGSDYD